MNPVAYMDGTISVIIPTYHSESLRDTLVAIVEQQAFDKIHEIIVVGQQESTGFAELPKVRFISVAERPTPARNRNIGAIEAVGEWLCFTDSDCIPEPDWIDQIRCTIVTGRAAVGGAVAVPSEIGYWGLCDHLLAFQGQLADGNSDRELNFAATLNFCIRRELFITLGGFDESFTEAAGEDLDFCWRLREAGYAIVFAPEAVVCHNHSRRDFVSTWRHLYRYGEALSQFRLRRGGSAAWHIAGPLIKLPLIGELAGFTRVGLRAFLRVADRPRLLRHWWALPGMAVLDCAHTLGIISATRTPDA